MVAHSTATTTDQNHPFKPTASSSSAASALCGTLFVCRNSNSDTNRGKRAAATAAAAAGSKLPAKCYNNKNSCLEACPNIKLQTKRAEDTRIPRKRERERETETRNGAVPRGPFWQAWQSGSEHIPYTIYRVYRVVCYTIREFHFSSANKSQLSQPISR